MDNNRHITEQEIDYFVGNPDALTADEKAAIQAHIDGCKLCSEQLSSTQNFYRELRERLEQHPSAYDEKLAEKLLRPAAPKLLPSDALIRAYAEIVQEQKPSLMRRVVGYARVHPVKTTGFATALAAALVLGFLAMRPVKDTNPAYAAIKNQILYVHNKNYEVIWSIRADGMDDFPKGFRPGEPWSPFNEEYYFIADRWAKYPVRVFDTDGDGTNEVFVSAAADYSPQFSRDSLYCFNSDGSLRWVFGTNRRGIQFGAVDFSASTNWYIIRFFSIQRTANSPVQLFVIAHHDPSWPTQIVELNTKTGQEIGRYWHAGGIGQVVVTDLEQDGVKEFVVAGVNNGFNRACVIVFDPANVSGVGPTSTELTPANNLPGSEKYYVLLPRSDIIESHEPYNTVLEIRATGQSTIIVQTNEVSRQDWGDNDYPGGFVYTFDHQMRAVNIVASSPFEKSLERAKREGLVRKDFQLDDAFYRRLKNEIRYWDGEKFVKEPILNRHYVTSHISAPLIIHRVTPETVVGNMSFDTLTVYGSGFSPHSKVVLQLQHPHTKDGL